MATHPQKIIDAHCHIGEIPPWKYYDLEHPVKPTVYDYKDTRQFVEQFNKRLPSMTVGKIVFTDLEFSRENGFLRPNLKLDRKKIGQHFQAEISALAAGAGKI